VPLEAVWGARGRGLRERILDAKTPDAKIATLERALLEASRGRLERDPCVAFALSTFDAVPHVHAIGRVSEKTGWSPRRFIQLFKESVGLTPKLYCRVRRFQAVLDHVASSRPFRWSDVAAACGYSDQAHLVRDFRAFAGMVPSAYTAGTTSDRRNHVPL
jgi:AraC-like DNA-binding protein